MFYQQDCIIIHNQETKILKKEFFTSNFDGNVQQLAGLSPGDSTAGVMGNGEMDFYNSSFIDFRVSYMNKICLVKPYQILHFFIKRYIMKTLWVTMMSPGD